MKLIENIKLRWRLWKVCRKLGIKPYKFQKQFALTGRCVCPRDRRQGKTMAVMLYGLIRDITALRDIYVLAQFDPDVGGYNMYRRDAFIHEYRELLQKVKEGKT